MLSTPTLQQVYGEGAVPARERGLASAGRPCPGTRDGVASVAPERVECRLAYMWSLTERFWHWVQQDGNANIILIAVTAWYVILTRRIVKATARQAVSMMQPELSICGFQDRDKPDGKFVLVENTGDHPVVILDLEKTCFVHGRKSLTHSDSCWMDAVIPPKKDRVFDYAFDQELQKRRIPEFLCAYSFDIVVGDLSRQVVSTYEYYPGTGQFICKLGMPWKVKFRHFRWQCKWRYHRAKPLIGKFQRWAMWENSEGNRLPGAVEDANPSPRQED
jgi:hypothetical protein